MMRKKEIIERYSVDERGNITPPIVSHTDWARVDALSAEDIERLADEEDGPLMDGWQKTIVIGIPEAKQDVHIRLDPTILRWFKSQGPGYQTRINTVLKAFVESQKRKERA